MLLLTSVIVIGLLTACKSNEPTEIMHSVENQSLEDNVEDTADSTSSPNLSTLSDTKLLREQTRENNEEIFWEIINNEDVSEQQKQEAINNMITIFDIIEKETASEILLMCMGFNDAVVCIRNESVEVIVNAAELSEAQRAQIEDIIIRNTGVSPDTLIINTLSESNVADISTPNLSTLSDAKLLREQARKNNEEILLEIINNEHVSEQQKQEAFNNMTTISDIVEKETSSEILLIDKGFSDVLVYITNNTVEVIVNATELSEAQRAQIEDIIVRKADISPETIIIKTLLPK